MTPWDRLPPAWYLRDTVTVARDLIGRYLVRETPRGRLCCRITETEAYCGPGDPACHSHKKASRSRSAPPGYQSRRLRVTSHCSSMDVSSR